MRSPRTTLQREWLIRIGLRPYTITSRRIPPRTADALRAGQWVILAPDGFLGLSANGEAWLEAFRLGRKSIGGVK